MKFLLCAILLLFASMSCSYGGGKLHAHRDSNGVVSYSTNKVKIGKLGNFRLIKKRPKYAYPFRIKVYLKFVWQNDAFFAVIYSKEKFSVCSISSVNFKFINGVQFNIVADTILGGCRNFNNTRFISYCKISSDELKQMAANRIVKSDFNLTECDIYELTQCEPFYNNAMKVCKNAKCLLNCKKTE